MHEHGQLAVVLTTLLQCWVDITHTRPAAGHTATCQPTSRANCCLASQNNPLYIKVCESELDSPDAGTRLQYMAYGCLDAFEVAVAAPRAGRPPGDSDCYLGLLHPVGPYKLYGCEPAGCPDVQMPSAAQELRQGSALASSGG